MPVSPPECWGYRLALLRLLSLLSLFTCFLRPTLSPNVEFAVLASLPSQWAPESLLSRPPQDWVIASHTQTQAPRLLWQALYRLSQRLAYGYISLSYGWIGFPKIKARKFYSKIQLYQCLLTISLRLVSGLSFPALHLFLVSAQVPVAFTITAAVFTSKSSTAWNWTNDEN